MKAKLGIAAAFLFLLVVLQLVFGGKNGEKHEPAAGSPVSGTVTAASVAPLPLIGEVKEVRITHPGFLQPVMLEKFADGWKVMELNGVPANGRKIEALLSALLQAEKEPAEAGVMPEGDEGVRVILVEESGREYSATVGPHPADSFDAAYVQYEKSGTFLVKADVRAALGLWSNRPDAMPEVGDFMERSVFRFSPSDVVEISVTYPDHAIALSLDEDGAWRSERPVPGGELDGGGMAAWLEDLAAFQVLGGVAGQIETDAGSPEPTHQMTVSLAGGDEKSMRVFPSHDGEGFLIRVSDYPGFTFHLPHWRFVRYFNRLDSIFPGAVPHYAADEVLSIDIRRGGESIKLGRSDGVWQAVALPFPPRQERVERLAHLLARWYPEDYADADSKGVRPGYGGPVAVETTLAGGTVHQYRLTGRHPLFPWRYVMLDGRQALSVSEADASAMFPTFADVLYLGSVFRRVDDSAVTRIVLQDGANDTLATFERDAGGGWFLMTEKGRISLEQEEGDRVALELLSWPVAGFLPSGMDLSQMETAYRIEVATRTDVSAVTLMNPVERDIPYNTDDGLVYLLDRADFQNWLGSVREITRQLEERETVVTGEDEADPETETPERIPEHEPVADGEAASVLSASEEPSTVPASSESDEQAVLRDSPEDDGVSDAPETSMETFDAGLDDEAAAAITASDGEEIADNDAEGEKATESSDVSVIAGEKPAAGADEDPVMVMPEQDVAASEDHALVEQDASDSGLVEVQRIPARDGDVQAGGLVPHRIDPAAVHYNGRVGGLAESQDQ